MNTLKYILILVVTSLNLQATLIECGHKNCITFKDIINENMSPPIMVVSTGNISTMYEWILESNFTKILVDPFKKYHSNLNKYLATKCNYIFFANDLNHLRKLVNFLININEINARGNFFIKFQKPLNKSEINRTFHYLWKNYITKSVIQTFEGKNFAWYPYHPKNKCGTKIHVNKVHPSRAFKSRIGGEIRGCPITISWNMYAIFMWHPRNKTFPGVLPLIINTISKILKFKPIYLTHNSEFLLNYLQYDDFETAEKDVEERKIDLIIYGSDNGRYMNLENLQDPIKSVTFNILVPSKYRIRMNYYFDMFSKTLLWCTLASFTICVIMWKQLTKISILDATFIVYRLFFQLNIPKIKQNVRAKHLLLFIMLFVFFINVKYNSYLSSLLTSPGVVKKLGSVNQIEMVGKGEKENTLSRFLYFTGFNQSLGRTSDGLWVIVPKEISAFNETFFNNYSHAYYFHMEHFKNFDRQIEMLQISSEQKITGIEYKIASRRGFPLNKKINYWIECISQSGLIQKWMSDQSVLLKKFIIEKPGVLVHLKLSYRHLRGVFGVLYIGWVISIAVLGVEIGLFRNGFYRFYMK